MIEWPGDLILALARRRAVVVIGSGVSANCKNLDGKSPPTWGEFLKKSYKKLEKKLDFLSQSLNQYDYLSACDYLKTEYGTKWPALLRENFVDPKFSHAAIHEHIFNLDSRIVISLNFDRVYDTYAIKSTDGSAIIKNYYDEDIRQVLAGNGTYILKPHGSIDNIPKMIFTLSDYSKERVSSANFYEMLSSLLHTHTFLLVGCGLSDPDVQLMFEDYRNKYSECPHYMTYPSPIHDRQIELIQRTRGINMLRYAAKENHKDLADSLSSLAVIVADARNAIAANQDW